MKWWHVYLLILGASLAASLVLTWLCRQVGRRFGVVDRPHREQHKRHEREVSLLGGFAICGAWVITLGAGLVVAPRLGGAAGLSVTPYLAGITSVLPKLGWISLGAVALVAMGFVDDRRPLGALPKLLVQFAVAGVTAATVVRITVFFSNPLLTWAITTFWFLFIINAINFFDNMDGLAGGTAAIASLLFLICAVYREQYFVAALAAATCGSCCGFLVFNWPPASIFMGDSGSHFLGYMLALIGAMTTFYTPLHSPTLAPVLIPLLILAIPIFDLFAVIVIRRSRGQPIYVGDNMHVSHRFEQMGFSRPHAMIIVHLLSLAIGAGALSLMWLPPPAAAIALVQTAALLALVTVLHAARLAREPVQS